MTNLEIRQQLQALAEEEYRDFAMKLTPGIENILGVRLPALRKLAREIAKGDWAAYLAAAEDDSFEEVMLQGLVIGYAKGTPAEILPHIRRFIPKINSWSICDTFCSNLKIAAKNKAVFWDFLQPYLREEEEFSVRFGVVMLIAHYITAEDIQRVLFALRVQPHPGYYVKMAVAWAVSVCFIKFPEETFSFLNDNELDDFTYNKALPTENHRISPHRSKTKARIRAMKRV